MSVSHLPHLERTQDLHEAPQRTPAFVRQHGPLFVLLATLAAQLLLLSFQISRKHNVRLIKLWTTIVFRPFQDSLHTGVDGTTRAWSRLHGLWGAEKDNQQLQADLAMARAEVRELSQQAAEAKRLRVLLGFKTDLSFPTVAAEVIASSPGETSRAIFINKGSDAKLTADLGVITPEGIVGKVIAVFPSTAQVLLITDASSGVGCILEKSRAQGVLKGEGRNVCQLRYISNDDSVSPGDEVVTSGLDQIYPKGLPVGRVVTVSRGSIYKNILVRPGAVLDRLETVLVCLKPASENGRALTAVPH